MRSGPNTPLASMPWHSAQTNSKRAVPRRIACASPSSGFFAGIGFALVLLYVLLGDPFTVDPADVLSTEHSLARTFTGTCYVLGIQAIVISAFLWLERKGIRFNVPVITWVGVNSILVFALHRILFVKLIVPFSGLIASMNGWILSADIIYVYTCILITLGICYFIKVSPVSDIILQKKR